MSTTRIYDPRTKQWTAVSSSDADNISVHAPSLIPEGSSETTVEPVLVNHESRLDKAESHIAWLALHGGGGSGTGGGGGINATIVVNGVESGGRIEFDEQLGLSIRVQAPSALLTFDITAATTAGTTIASATNSTTLQITKAMLDKFSIDRTFTLSISAYNPDSESFVFWNGTIIISNIQLSGIDAQYSYRADGQYIESVIFNYEIDSTGSYAFYINDTYVEEFSGTYNTVKGELSLSLARLAELGVSLSPGLNVVSASLRNANNESVRGDYSLLLTLLTESPIITCHTISTDPASPTSLGLYSDSIAVQIPFTVWYSGTSFQYKIASATVPGGSAVGQTPAPDTSLIPWSSAYISYNQQQSNASILLEGVELGQAHVIRVMIRDSTSQLTYYQDFFIRLAQPTSSLITTNLHPLFDFCSYTSTISNGASISNGYALRIQNENYKSQSIQAQTKSLRLQNASFATIDVSAIKQAITMGNQLEFSLNIQYRADYHPDDERTILQWGLLNSQGTNSTGLMVRAHDFYLGNSRLFSLEDQELIDITITYKSIGTNAGKAFVYVDGVPEAVEDYDPNLIIDQILQGGSVPPLFIAAATTDILPPPLGGGSGVGASPTITNYCDCDIYRIAFYDTCLSPLMVMYEHLNNEARAHLTPEGLPNTDYITDGLLRNLIISDADSTSPSDIRIGNKRLDSQLYREVSSSFDNNAANLLENFNLAALVGEVSGTLQLNATLKNYKVPIPIVFIDMSKDGWTYSEFVKPGASNLNKTTAVLHYYDQNATNKSFLTTSITAEPQGTSTLADYIKNLHISFPDDVIFCPKPNWFPEAGYDLKADIVDSSHSINTAYGRFVNEEFGFNTATNASKWYPFSQTMLSTFNAERNKQGSPMRTYFPEATIKHGVEGFSVLVVIAFTPEQGDTPVIKSLGIYQFILGRKSPRNLGYEIITGVNGVSNVTYPLLVNNASLSTKSVNGYWFEFNENDSFGVSEDFQGLADQPSSAFSAFRFTGAFWQASANYYNENVDVKYSNLPQPVNNAYDFEPFTDFVSAIQRCPVMLRRRTSAYSKIDIISTTNSYREYSYDWVVSGGNGRYEWRDTGKFIDINTSDALMSLIYNANDQSGVINIECISKFFPLAMFAGLLDNFQKNLPLKFYQRPDGSWEPALLGIYDNDSGIGQDNQSDQNVDEALWMSGIVNSGLGFIESHTGPNKQVVANNNKMWFIDTPEFVYAYLQRFGYSIPPQRQDYGSIFASAWNDMKRTLIANGSIRSINDLADYFYDHYFLPQTEGCGELLFSLTYIAKYITKYETDSGATNQINKLHGRRRYQVKHWLRNRVKFLDSMFNAMGVLSFDTPVNTPAEVTIGAATGPSCAVKMNTPLITKYANQGNTTGWMFCNKNVETDLYFGAPELTSDYSKTHSIQHPNNIIALGKGEHPLYNIGFATINTGALPYLTVFDVSAPSRSASNMNGLALMNDSWMSSHFRGDNGTGVSELRTIDFRNTFPRGDNTYNINLRNGFDKLQNLYINDSCVNTITFPEGVPLRDFNVAGSKLNSLFIENQGFISKLDLTNCDELVTLTVNNCAGIRNLNIGMSNVRLNSVSVSSNNLEQFTAENNSVRRISLVSTGLRSVTIASTSLESLELGAIESLTTLNLSHCPNLRTISFSFSESALVTVPSADSGATLPPPLGGGSGVGADISYPLLTTINLYDTSVTTTTISGIRSDILDLSIFTALTDVNIGGNDQVEYIQFANIPSAPIPLIRTFTGCTNLKRIYGHVAVNVAAAFQNCASFSIHGSDLGTGTWFGTSVLAPDGRVMMPHELLIAAGSITSINDIPSPTAPATSGGSASGSEGATPSVLFQPGTAVTNLSFGTSSANNTFYGTAYTIFDVYYFFTNLGAVTTCSGTFRQGVNADFGVFNWTEDCDNSPNARMFHWANRVTTLTNLFYGCGSGHNIRLFSPTRNGSQYNQDGLYSMYQESGRTFGLASCTSISWMWGSYVYYIDRHIFRTNGYAARPLTSIGYFYPRLIVDDVNILTTVPEASASAIPSWNIDDYGNLAGFFQNLGNLTDIHAFCDGTIFINYNLIDNTNFRIPAGVKTLKAVFRSSYAAGEIRPQDYFASPSSVVNIYHSFRVANQAPSVLGYQPFRCQFFITAGMFDAFTSLESIGYLNSGDNSATVANPSFNGAGLDKEITGAFPYTLFANCRKLKQLVGFFMNATYTGSSAVALPGPMFANTTLIENIDYLFYNVQFNYTLSDNQPFARCTNLSTLSYAFAQSATNSFRPRLTGTIPVRFFFTGSTTRTVILQGNNAESFDTQYEYDMFGSVISATVVANPRYDADGNVIGGDPMTIQSETHTYSQPITSITDMSYCFQHSGFDEYVNTNPTTEGNIDYSPFRNTYSPTAGWAQNAKRNLHPRTYMWEYDGANHPAGITPPPPAILGGSSDGGDTSPSPYDNLDEMPAAAIIPSITTNIASLAGTANFCCPPDIFRWCAPNCNIEGIFAYSGTTGWSTQYNNGFSLFEYGITGRIPPHLLRPVPNTTSIADMFRYCRRISSYAITDAGVSYAIPRTFFSYAPAIQKLNYAFSGLVFPSTIVLNLFGYLTRTIDVTGIFYQCYYNASQSSRAFISSVFQGNNISACSYAFALSTTQGGQEAISRSQYVTFSNIFRGYTNSAYRTNMSFAYVFNGYSKSTVQHETPKTLCNNTVTLNYAYASTTDGIAPD